MPDYKNEVHLIGTVGYDPELRTVNADGLKLAKFSVTTSIGRGKTFVGVLAWAELAESVEQLRIAKGTWVDVRGKIKTSSWKTDGGKRYKTEVVAYEIGVIQEGESMDASGIQDRLQPEGGEDEYMPF